ncbi:MAG: NAD(P)/FAD-dependent oxidoreductase [Verrucomicrobiae bacterium]|nr:NAD(P)/FAD-dependent oxidoreductase [Verrucomicrobiae bacterium]
MRENEYDIVILGGALSGTAMAILLKRERPHLRVAIVEKSIEFDRKVGESTSEVAGCFLTKVLNLSGYLYRTQIAKHGLRMWFTSPENESMGRCSEIGGDFQPKLPGFQLDRAQVDAHLLDLAVEAGCELIRPATIRSFELGGIGKNAVEIKAEGGEMRTLRADWVVDASGKAALIGRKRGTIRRLEDHPTNAIWARFRGTKDFDGHELRSKFAECYGKGLHAPRGTATNHLMGYGWWCWIIPLQNGDVSAGLTWDTRLFTPPEGKNLTERLHQHLLSHPVGREIFGEAMVVEKDTRTYSHLPYYNEEVMGEGWAVVGDAGGFMDPLYSQGIDYIGYTVYSVHKIILDALGGADVEERITGYNAAYQASYHTWYAALYKNKYQYLGDAELMHAAFVLDLAAYFIGPVRLAYEFTDQEFQRLPYVHGVGPLVGKFMSFYNRRLAAIARKRRASGKYGAENVGRRFIISEGFNPSLRTFRLLAKGIGLWLRAEVRSAFLRSPGLPHVEERPSKTRDLLADA